MKGRSQTVGNEYADEIAKAVAKGITAEGECITYEEPSNDRRHKFWPYKGAVEASKQANSPAAESTMPRRPLDNLQDAVKEQALKRHRFGMANRNTTYFEAQKRVENHTDVRMSNMFMTTSKVTFSERKVALRYRLGSMWTRKMAYRFGHAPDSRCLLCGQEDGGHHTASGCPKLKRMYIDRHNKVGRAIMTRVMQGRLGAYVLQMDLGSREHCAAEGLTHQPRHLPWDVLPSGLKQYSKQALPPTPGPTASCTSQPLKVSPQSTGLLRLKYAATHGIFLVSKLGGTGSRKSRKTSQNHPLETLEVLEKVLEWFSKRLCEQALKTLSIRAPANVTLVMIAVTHSKRACTRRVRMQNTQLGPQSCLVFGLMCSSTFCELLPTFIVEFCQQNPFQPNICKQHALERQRCELSKRTFRTQKVLPVGLLR